VWSPDSKTILLNEIRDELKGTKDIYLLDLATQKMTRKFKDVPPVFGWAEAK
jgi:Tol biopolymer transport system component